MGHGGGMLIGHHLSVRSDAMEGVRQNRERAKRNARLAAGDFFIRVKGSTLRVSGMTHRCRSLRERLQGTGSRIRFAIPG